MSEEALGTEKLWKLIWKMSLPCILAQIVNLLYNLVDRIYIGHMASGGSEALAGLGLCSPILLLIAAFAAFAYGGGAPLASRALGAKDHKLANKYLGNSAFLLLVFSGILMIVLYIFKKPVLYLIGASDSTFPYADEYITVYLAGTVFVHITVGLNAFITAQGKSRLAMVSTLIGAVINIALDPLFIFVFHMGIRGAAIATVISQAVSAVWILLILMNPKITLHLSLRNLIPDVRILWSVFRLGIANFVMASTESIIGFVLNGRLKAYGGDIHVSNLAILQSTMTLISTLVSGFTSGVSPIISYNYGAGKMDRVKGCFLRTLLVCFLTASLLGGSMMLFPGFYAGIFTTDPELIELAKEYMPIFTMGMLIFGSQRACQTTFVALGESLISLCIAILRKIVLLVPLACLLPMFLGVKGVYLAEGVADLMSATICGTLFFFRFRYILKREREKASGMKAESKA